MELKAFFRVLRRRWWVVVPIFLLTLGATALMTAGQDSVYESTSTFIVRVAAAFQDDRSMVSAVDTLSRRNEIASTFAEVATSRFMKNQASEQLGLSPEERRSLSINSQLVAGTNILEITAEGTSSELAARYANAVGEGTVAYVQDLYEVFELAPLDAAVPPASPSTPNRSLNLALGAIFGLTLGVGFAFLVEYLRSPSESVIKFNILDDETGMYTKQFFMLRLRQEMARSGRNRYPLSMALVDVDPHGTMTGDSPIIRRDALRRAAMSLEVDLRDEDIMAHFDDTVFAILLPDVSGPKAIETVASMQARLDSTPLELERSGITLNVHSLAGVTTLQNGAGPDELVVQARHALEEAETAAHAKISLYSNGRHGD